MQTHIGKAIRLGDILATESFLLDTTIASCIGARSYLDDLKAILHKYSGLFDGIIVNPGQLEHLSGELGGKNRAAPLVRADWTNAYRDDDFCLPVTDVKRVEISHTDDAMNLGASAAVATLLLGFGDEFEASNIQSISRFIRASYSVSLPVVVDIRPVGPGVSEVNFEDSVKLGVSFMMEAGADALILPDCSQDTLKLICDWSTVPVIVRTDRSLTKIDAKKIFSLGINGILFSEKVLENGHFVEEVGNLIQSVRPE